jgi:ubiquinol-cytochrome c reductase core subunit 2
LGGRFSASHSRENVVLNTKFLAEDLPYFVELLAEVASQTKFPGTHNHLGLRLSGV